MKATHAARERGGTLIECLVALTVLSLVLTTSLVVLQRRTLYLRQIDERLHALHAAEKELETVRSMPFFLLLPRADGPFLSEPTELESLEAPQAAMSILETEYPLLRKVRVEITWGKKAEKTLVSETLLSGEPLGRIGPEGHE